MLLYRSTGTIAAASTTNTSMVDSALHSSTLSRQAKPTAATQPPSLSSAVREPRLRESREPTRAPVPASSPASTTASAEVTAPAATDYDQTSASIVSMSMASGIHSDAAVSSTDEEGGNVTSAGGQARRRSPRLLQSALVTRRPLGDDNQADRREQQSKRDLGHGAMCNKPGDEDEPRHSERQRSEKGECSACDLLQSDSELRTMQMAVCSPTCMYCSTFALEEIYLFLCAGSSGIDYCTSAVRQAGG